METKLYQEQTDLGGGGCGVKTVEERAADIKQRILAAMKVTGRKLSPAAFISADGTCACALGVLAMSLGYVGVLSRRADVLKAVESLLSHTEALDLETGYMDWDYDDGYCRRVDKSSPFYRVGAELRAGV